MPVLSSWSLPSAPTLRQAGPLPGPRVSLQPAANPQNGVSPSIWSRVSEAHPLSVPTCGQVFSASMIGTAVSISMNTTCRADSRCRHYMAEAIGFQPILAPKSPVVSDWISVCPIRITHLCLLTCAKPPLWRPAWVFLQIFENSQLPVQAFYAHRQIAHHLSVHFHQRGWGG